jgi:hypothetical protein
MSNFVFNIAKGRVVYYGTLPAASDALILVPLQSTGLEIDATLADYTNLSALLAGTTNEQTTMGRKTLANITVVINNTDNTVMVDCDDVTYTAATGVAVGAFVVCYVPNNGAPNDTTTIPLTKHDFSVIPSGANIPVQVSANGIFTASS